MPNYYKSTYFTMKIINVITYIIKNPILSNIKNSQFLDIQIDSSKDITSHKLLFLIIRYINEFNVI